MGTGLSDFFQLPNMRFCIAQCTIIQFPNCVKLMKRLSLEHYNGIVVNFGQIKSFGPLSKTSNC